MNSQQRKILEQVFGNPVNGNLEWRKIESLLLAVGCVRTEGAGSSVAFMHSGVTVRFHRPHPQRAALRYRVLDARKFLEMIGVKP
ncbi:MAG: type II toxin-antitoxin system HicA family toxin [Burkholderiales bacterium]|nr:type II toxin-antitoxin system HicA family toxin [Burkholderiales bacterium]MBK9347059.1 type II toxin-antitoxin system HicA family toxin [Burkholderiales bacterium]